MNIKVDVTTISTFADGKISTLVFPGYFTKKTIQKPLKNFFGEQKKFQLLELHRDRNIEIPVINDSITESLEKFFIDKIVVTEEMKERGTSNGYC